MRARLALLVIAIFALSASVSSARVPGGFTTEDTCAAVLIDAVFTEDAGACGNQSYRWYYLDSSPPGGYYVGSFGDPCSYSQYGWITYVWNGQYRYTVQCRQA